MIYKAQNSNRTAWYSKIFQSPETTAARVSLFIVVAISILDLVGKIFRIHFFSELGSDRNHMAVSTNICFGLIIIALIVLISGKHPERKRIIPSVSGILIILLSVFIILKHILIKSGVMEETVAWPSMSLVLASLFLLTGIVIMLISTENRVASNLAHILLFPVGIVSYFIPVTYLLGVYGLAEFKDVEIGFGTGMSLVFVSSSLLFIRPDTWLVKVYTSPSPGGVMARKMLPTLIILPLIIGWLRILGEHSGYFKSEVGVAYVAIAYTVSYILLVWVSARSVNKTSEDLQFETVERKKAEESLEISRVHLERAQEIAHLGSWELDLITNKLNWSDEVYRIFGLVPREFKATYEAFLEAVHPDDRAAVDNSYSSSLKENRDSYDIQHRIIRKKTGEIRYVHEKCQHFRNESGQVIRSMGMVHDITDRIKTENDLKGSKERLNIALEIGNIGIWEWDLYTDEMILDDRMEQIFVLNHGSFGGTYEDFERLLNEEDIPHFKRSISQALNEEIPLETIFRVKGNGEENRYVHTRAIVEKDGYGVLCKMTGVCFDITEMKKSVEHVLVELNDELLRSNNELEQFAYIVSHDLQEPLRMISSFTQLLSKKYKDKLDLDAQEYIKFIIDGSSRLQNQIMNLLTLSRIQTRGKEFSNVEMQDVIEQALSYLNSRIIEKNAIITFDLKATVHADEEQMVQLFQNLIGNAIKYCRRRPEINISVREEGKNYLISVKDNGIGMEKQYLDRIFRIFQRLHSKDEYEGSGIGLAICRRIVERHKGKIWAESEPETGSTFIFTIPRILKNGFTEYKFQSKFHSV